MVRNQRRDVAKKKREEDEARLQEDLEGMSFEPLQLAAVNSGLSPVWHVLAPRLAALLCLQVSM